MTSSPSVLLIEDQVGDLLWLLDLIRGRGYEVVLATNEDEANQRLAAVQAGSESYALAIVDVAVALKDLMDLANLDDQFFEDSQNTGIRLCRYARKELGISEAELPMACLTVRDDDEVKAAMEDLRIPLFNKAPQSPAESIRGFLDTHLPDRNVGAVSAELRE
jgi:CheY-like chemotaxis protein